MAALCPSCRRDIDPFVAHFCGDSWERSLTTSTSSSPASASCCLQGCSCGDSGTAVPTTGGTVPNTGVESRVLTVHPDSRGNVRETYRASWFPGVPPVRQLVRSESVARTLRGMHLHRRQWDLWYFVSGAAVVRLLYADGTQYFARHDAGSVLAIPPGVAHGFYTEDGCILMYALTEEYTGDDEFGFYPFDGLTEHSHPAWPRDHINVVVSERDLRATRLAEFAW